MDDNKTQHWQNLYNQWLIDKNFNTILSDKLFKGLFANSTMRYQIPADIRDDYFQCISIAVFESFEKYSKKECDKILPYLLRGIQIATMNFLNSEIYNGTMLLKQPCITTHDEIPEDLQSQSEYDDTTDKKIDEMHRWLKQFIKTDIEWDVFCYQWGIFDHEKLKTNEISRLLNMTEDEIKKIKLMIKMHSYAYIGKNGPIFKTKRTPKQKIKKYLIIGGKKFQNQKEAANYFNVSIPTISHWVTIKKARYITT